jgi:hypothetical protein
MRALCVAMALLLAGCGSSGIPHRTAPRVILGLIAAGGAAVAIGAGLKGNSIESKLKDDLAAGNVTGRQFASRDADGERWNRIGRGATFVSALAVLGLGVLWEMSMGDHSQYDAPKPAQQGPIFPVPAPSAALPAPIAPATR